MPCIPKVTMVAFTGNFAYWRDLLLRANNSTIQRSRVEYFDFEPKSKGNNKAGKHIW